MCLLIAKPQGKKLDKEQLATAFRSNPDGAGFAIADEAGKRILVRKGFFDFDKFCAEFQPFENCEAIVHFRIATSGLTNHDNCHPFEIKSEMFPEYTFAMAHNGSLPFRNTKTKSDTNCFSTDVLKKIFDRDPYFLEHDPGYMLLAKAIEKHNKMAIMRHDAEKNKFITRIINDDAASAHWEKGIWYSNYSYKYFTQRFRGRVHGGMGHFGDDEDWENYRGRTASPTVTRQPFQPVQPTHSCNGKPNDLPSHFYDSWVWNKVALRWENKYSNKQLTHSELLIHLNRVRGHWGMPERNDWPALPVEANDLNPNNQKQHQQQLMLQAAKNEGKVNQLHEIGWKWNEDVKLWKHADGRALIQEVFMAWVSQRKEDEALSDEDWQKKKKVARPEWDRKTNPVPHKTIEVPREEDEEEDESESETKNLRHLTKKQRKWYRRFAQDWIMSDPEFSQCSGWTQMGCVEIARESIRDTILTIDIGAADAKIMADVEVDKWVVDKFMSDNRPIMEIRAQAFRAEV